MDEYYSWNIKSYSEFDFLFNNPSLYGTGNGTHGNAIWSNKTGNGYGEGEGGYRDGAGICDNIALCDFRR